jgi:DNA-directed RNA polymerase specialized sigma24 family protein
MNEISLVLNVPGTQPNFDELFRSNFNQVFSYELRLVGDIPVAHRLAEESFDELARYYRKGRTPTEARALLYLLATARARDYLRHGDRQTLWQRLFSRPQDPTVEFTEDEVTAVSQDTNQRALNTLEFASQVVLLLHDYCGLPYDDVARAAGIGRTSVARDLDRARHEFKQAYDYIKF